VARLRELAAVGLVRTITPVRPGHLQVGSVTSEGDAAAQGPQARATGFDGTGVKVGVISDGVDHLAQSISTGNLAAGTGVPAGTGCAAGSGDEGTAMLEIVHDLAPGATLMFSQGLSDKLAFVDSVNCLETNGAQVIVDDLGFFDEPYFQDGMVAQAVRAAVQAGVSYHSAAGNSAQIHYGGAFRATQDAATGNIYHAFSGAANGTFDRMDVVSGAVIECILQWNDPWGASANDYDLELWNFATNPPTLLETSSNVQNGSQDPIEILVPLQNVGAGTAHVGLRVRRVSGADRQLSFFCLGASNLQFVTPAGSIFGHPALTETVAVAAIDIHDNGLNAVEAFSSQGPSTVYFPALQVRPKPDIAGFDGVTTSVCPSVPVCFDPFFGTSAAAPHSAAVAALVLSRNSCLTPAQVQQTLADAADDIPPLGIDSLSGAGRLDALRAITAPGPCDDHNACTVDTCTPATGCQHTVVPDGTSCTDGNLCNGAEVCHGTTCTPGTPLVCDDGNPCTSNLCAPATGCLFVDACDDGDPCTTDSCDLVTGCQHTPAPDGTPCPDQNLCNGDEVCQTGTCAAGSPLTCDTGPECTTSACDARAGCTYPALTGFAGVACLCATGLAPTSCGSTAAPGPVVARFARACGHVAKAAGLSRRRRARSIVMQAVRTMGAAERGAQRALRRGGLSPDCATSLTATLEDARTRALSAADAL
jgi:subtilisin family serine protease